MRFILSGIVAISAFGFAGPAHAGGVAMCVERIELPSGLDTEGQYWLRYGADAGWQYRTKAREDYEQRKSRNARTFRCQASPDDLKTGQFVVISTTTTNYKGERVSTIALGFGANRTAAIAEAKAELGRKNWEWQDSKHGYVVIQSGFF